MSEGRRAHPPRRGGDPRRDDRRGTDARGRPRRPARALTTAERRAAEVRANRAPRPERDPEAERAKIEGRTLDTWIDEGVADDGVRRAAAGATSRATAAGIGRRRRDTKALDPAVATEITNAASDRRRAARLVDRLAEAQTALDRDRLDEARRLVAPLLKEVPGIAAVHELAGFVGYRLGRWRDAVRELEAAQAIHSRVELLPALADSYRALRRWNDVERIWSTIKEISPSQDVLAEGRIVAAGAHADRGDLTSALKVMAGVGPRPKRVRDHHLRQWYVLGDLNDRAGNPIEAVRWFDLIARGNPEFVDVVARLRALGR